MPCCRRMHSKYMQQVKKMVFASSLMILVLLQPPRAINCDNILYYTILYRPVADDHVNTWERRGAQKKDNHTTLDSLQFETNYEVSIAVVNNDKLSSSMSETNFRTASKSSGMSCHNLMFIKCFN